MARDARALARRRIVVTRAREQAGDLVQALQALGAQVLAVPVIRIEPLPDLEPLRRALQELDRYRWVVFTSQNAVRIVLDSAARWGLGPASFARTAVAAIGPATAAALERSGVTPALVPGRFVAEAVLEAILRRGPVAGARVLLPRAAQARDALPEGLRAHGALVEVIPVYRTVREPGDGGTLARELLAGRIDAVTFTSSSTVRGFVDLVGPEAAASGRYAAAVIGPVAAATAREAGIRVAVEAPEFTVAGLVDALARHFGAAP